MGFIQYLNFDSAEEKRLYYKLRELKTQYARINSSRYKSKKKLAFLAERIKYYETLSPAKGDLQ